MFDYTLLKAAGIKRFGSIPVWAAAMRVTPKKLYNMLEGASAWRAIDIYRCAAAIGIPKSKMYAYFFTEAVTE